MLGSAVVDQLLGQGAEVRILSRRRPGILPPGCEHIELDLADETGGLNRGLASALEGVGTVVDAANNTARPGPVMIDGSRRLISACRPAGVDHFVGVSIVGCEKVGLPYYRAKTRQEELVRQSPVGWSLLRATQFHELIDGLFRACARFRLLPGGRAPLQPVAAAVAAAKLASVATGQPLNSTSELTGPEPRSLGDLARQWRAASGRGGLIVPIPLLGRTGRAVSAGAFTGAAGLDSGPTFGEWLKAHRA